MTLSNAVIQTLNEIESIVGKKDELADSEIEQIKDLFYEILKKGTNYDVEEIESWFSKEKGWKNKDLVVRITNLSHYVQNKFEQTSKFRIIDKDSCGCND
ncbi:MAG: hypothetical protein GWN01_14145 [Nitrosopumilaceae archaeon]|nr:hypothetical protein [Nitrosopumilaceae archaeon]NIU01999.1 hypothetical protein [Nitrosopumilaceae archaeon]NIU87150.1 hypothetical protein [Nitrosopumilaceae archaeon]NIV64640.1 hypothetical protein [Nitrosopumilaceae archaeon]NIX62600.1 hypothetical protein [Nitrosopumilaceae archaeon]